MVTVVSKDNGGGRKATEFDKNENVLEVDRGTGIVGWGVGTGIGTYVEIQKCSIRNKVRRKVNETPTYPPRMCVCVVCDINR